MNEGIEIDSLGFVVIGRNEGERLKAGLRAIKSICPNNQIIYVDSGSTDESVEFSRTLAITVVELDMSIPFTAARARNAGFEALLASAPGTKYVQFLDGDCKLLPDWPDAAIMALKRDSTIGVVSGRRIEQHPDASVYNAIMDIEWNTPVGETKAVLGDMCVRTDVFSAVGGFSKEIIAAEDDDICLRIRRAGFRVYRLDADMSEHDANITRIAQWYRRSMRGGHGFAQINSIHGKGPERHFRAELRRSILWGCLVPLFFVAALFAWPALALVMLVGYMLLILRVAIKRYREGYSLSLSLSYGFLMYTSKIPEFIGVLKYWRNHLLSRDHTLIEYK